ncbi:GTP-binding protein [Halarchaeum grantii]|uniref:GTP-binding protein n=1 Tax=Halarchaeum grantii TaxID=1193105 RepID=A0A830F044_9EURY|nr:EF-Tu/IF-2/RF-3 family GTPase [Halarchaeum grantii]GGL26429.1 GTP-binding protein [Halarchaeum grantii]
MSVDRSVLHRALERGEQEGGNVEFKERLSRDVHLADGRLESLAAQLRHRVLSGDGEAQYVVGVTDDGGIAGVDADVFSETLDVLSLLAEEAGAHIDDVQTWGTDGEGLVGVATVRDGGTLTADDDHIIVGTAGHVDHGKSTLVGSLVTGRADDGDGDTRGFLDVQPHEVERGLSADLSYGVYGFDGDGPVRVENPHRKHERAAVVEEADRVNEVEREVERLLRTTGRAPLPVARHGVDAAVEETDDAVVPIVRTSAVDEAGLDVLDELFARLPKTAAAGGDFRLYVDRSYKVTGVGAVASGTIESGTVEAGDELLLGPFGDGSFREVEVRSIEMHYHRVDRAEAGRIVGIALKGVRESEVERGMALLPRDADPTPVRAFEADVMVLNHPTRIDAGYEPVVHLETASEAARFHPEGGQLLPGDTGTARIEFKFRPYVVEEGQRFVFREGSSKGVGTVTEILD